MARFRDLARRWRFLCLGLLFAASGAEGARQGSLGATSTGSIGISLSIAPRATIGIEDIDLGALEGQYRATRRVCLSSNYPAGSYTVAATGSGHGGAFELVNGSESIGYTVEWSARAQSHPVDRTPGESTRAELDAVAIQVDCASGSSSADLAIAIDPTRASATRSGAPYTGTLTLLVSPN